MGRILGPGPPALSSLQEQAEPTPHPRPESPWPIPSLYHFGSSLDVHDKLAEASRDQAPLIHLKQRRVVLPLGNRDTWWEMGEQLTPLGMP